MISSESHLLLRLRSTHVCAIGGHDEQLKKYTISEFGLSPCDMPVVAGLPVIVVLYLESCESLRV